MTLSDPINLLVILIVSGRQAGDLMQRLTRNKFYFTEIDSTSGVIHEPTVSLLLGLNKSRLEPLLELVRKCCQPQREYVPTQLNLQSGYSTLPMIEAQVGGALLYTMNVESFEQL